MKVVFTTEYLLFLFYAAVGYIALVGFIISYEDMVRSVDPENSQEFIDFYGNTFFTSSVVSLLIALVVDSYVRKLKPKEAAKRKVKSFNTYIGGILLPVEIIAKTQNSCLLSGTGSSKYCSHSFYVGPPVANESEIHQIIRRDIRSGSSDVSQSTCCLYSMQVSS